MCPDRGTKTCPGVSNSCPERGIKRCPGVTKRCPERGIKRCPGVTKRCPERCIKRCPGVTKRCPQRGIKKCPDRTSQPGHLFVPRSGQVWFPVHCIRPLLSTRPETYDYCYTVSLMQHVMHNMCITNYIYLTIHSYNIYY